MENMNKAYKQFIPNTLKAHSHKYYNQIFNKQILVLNNKEQCYELSKRTNYKTTSLQKRLQVQRVDWSILMVTHYKTDILNQIFTSYFDS